MRVCLGICTCKFKSLRVCKRALSPLELHPEDCVLTDVDAGN